MAAQWERWLKYAKAKLDDTVSRGESELDRLEAEQAARAEGKPWLSGSGDAPTFDEAKARIQAQAEAAGRTAPPAGPSAPTAEERPPNLAKPSPTAAPAGDAIDMAAQRQAAEERLAQMRRELGLDDSPPPT